ncbi:hypothetical protein MT391_20075 [Vibrio sp. 1-Bac 57]
MKNNLVAHNSSESMPLSGEHQVFSDISLSCSQFVDHECVHAHLRVSVAKRDRKFLRFSINGRDGHAECFLENEIQLDDLINRLLLIQKNILANKVRR